MKEPVTQCLLVKTPDDRIFFTHENNFSLLIEFGRTFSTEISVVDAPRAKVLELEELVKSICTQDNQEPTEYKVIKTLIPKGKPKATQIESGKCIMDHLRNELLGGKTINLADLATKWPDVSDLSTQRYMMKARRELTEQGYNIVRVGTGQYKVKGSL